MLTTSLAWVGHGSIGLGQSGADHTALISPIFCVRQLLCAAAWLGIRRLIERPPIGQRPLTATAVNSELPPPE